jgi:N-acetylglucosaminyldiphosphoundecaprenol N-acetyl-beta-D-mannosaminyltransferase
MSCQTIYTLNALTLLLAYQDTRYASVVARADMTLADGVGCLWACRKLRHTVPEKVSGMDLILALCSVCVAEQRSVFLYGAKPGVAEQAAKNLQQRFPGLIIAGTEHGYQGTDFEDLMVDKINRSQASLLLVALGQPRQEIWIDRWQEKLQVRMAVGVGGCLDVLAGRVVRAPHWMQRMGCEWLFRMLQEPWRWTKLGSLIRFVWLVWMIWPKQFARHSKNSRGPLYE